MGSPLQGAIAKAVYSGLKGLFIAATLTRENEVQGGAEFDPLPTTQTAYSCLAVVEAYSQKLRADGLVDANDRKVLIPTKSLEVTPKTGDTITVNNVTFRAIEVETDPATAVWVVRGRM